MLSQGLTGVAEVHGVPQAFDADMAEKSNPISRVRQNDVSFDIALESLTVAQGFSKHFRGFVNSDLEKLAKDWMQFFEVAKDDAVVVEGEKATFFCVVLRGAIIVEKGSLKRTTYKGEMFGEMSFFSGGIRNATCRSAQHGTVVGVLMYSAVEAMVNHAPAVAHKLMNMLAQACMAKLSDQLNGLEPSELFVGCPMHASEVYAEMCAVFSSDCFQDISQDQLVRICNKTRINLSPKPTSFAPRSRARTHSHADTQPPRHTVTQTRSHADTQPR